MKAKKVRKFFDSLIKNIKKRPVYTRIITVACLLIALIGLLGSFIRVQFSASLTGPFGNTWVAVNDVTAADVSLRDFANFSDVGAIKLFGEPIDTYEVAGVNIYETLENPPQSKGYLDKVINDLDPETLNSLTEADFQQQMTDNFPKHGEEIFNIVSSTSRILLESRTVLVSLDKVIDVEREIINDASKILDKIEQYKTVINVIVFIFMLMVIVPIVLLFIPAVPVKTARVFCYICGSLVLILGIGVIVGNVVVSNLAQQAVGEINASINAQMVVLLDGALGDKAGFIDLLGKNTDYLSVTPQISLGIGAIVAFTAFVGAIVASYFIPQKRRGAAVKSDGEEKTAAAEVKNS